MKTVLTGKPAQLVVQTKRISSLITQLKEYAKSNNPDLKDYINYGIQRYNVYAWKNRKIVEPCIHMSLS